MVKSQFFHALNLLCFQLSLLCSEQAAAGFFFLPWLLNTAVSCFSIVSLTMPQLHASLGLGHQILLSALFIAQHN
jgi:hypothetical protein